MEKIVKGKCCAREKRQAWHIIFCHSIVYLWHEFFRWRFFPSALAMHTFHFCVRCCLLVVLLMLDSIQFSGCSARHTDKQNKHLTRGLFFSLVYSSTHTFAVHTLARMSQTFDKLIDATQFFVAVRKQNSPTSHKQTTSELLLCLHSFAAYQLLHSSAVYD